MNQKPDRAAILAANKLGDYLHHIGVKMFGTPSKSVSNRCAAIDHKASHLCVSIDLIKEVWHCNDCKIGGSVIDWMAISEGRTISDVLKSLTEKLTEPTESKTSEKPQIIATYDYVDENSEMLYQVLRLHPKSFRQRRPDDSGGWVWDMNGVSRVLYRLPEVIKADTVFHTEGEKDADNVQALGLTATTSAGGSSHWLDAYADSYVGKHVVVIPDNDPPGWKYAKAVIASIEGKAVSGKIVPMPEPHKDVSDFIASFKGDSSAAKKALLELVEKVPNSLKPIPLLNVKEMEERYRSMVQRLSEISFDLGRFLPSFGRKVRRLIPGQLVVLLASTGVGKTAILQSIARAAKPLPTVFFELELPAEDMFERFVQMEVGCTSEQVETEYKTLPKPAYEHYRGLSHILLCPQSGLKTADIETIIHQSQLKFGRKPCLVIVDYIGLIQSDFARSRYESISNAAESLKVIAKKTETIIIMASQVQRPSEKKKTLEVSLTDGKDSGSIENSAGLVLGAWRPEIDNLKIKILKNTHGRTGDVIDCNFDGKFMRITERANNMPWDECEK